MRILVLADIHSNWPALAAIQERFDACLFLGDAVEYGADPIPCIEWLREHATACVRGNHDHAVAQRVVPRPGNAMRRLAAATRTFHWEMLSNSHRKFLARLPLTNRIRLDGYSFYLVHGTPRDPLDEYLVDSEEMWRERLQGLSADFVCVGHSHVPFHLEIDGRQILNPGSVGQPRDGDPRASYAIIEDGRVEFRRVAYDVNVAVEDLKACGLEGEVLEFAERVLRTGGREPPPADEAANGAPDRQNPKQVSS
jgi:putative phosphoesterase